MNKFVKSLRTLDSTGLKEVLAQDRKWVTWRDAKGRTGFHILGSIGCKGDKEKQKRTVKLAKVLISPGADIDAVHEIYDDGEVFAATPTWYAYARGNNRTLVEFLLKQGAKPISCLWAIAWNNDSRTAQLFADYGALFEEQMFDETPLLHALKYRRFNVADTFVRIGANINFQDSKGCTALHYAVLKNFTLKEVSSVLALGCDASIKNNDGDTAIELAQAKGKRKVSALLGGAST